MSSFEAKDFFKVYLFEHSCQTMLIPPAAVVHSCKLMPVTATLRNCKGQYWHVEVDESDGKMYFKEGWRKFVEQNSIKDREFLVFSYLGCSVFDVRVFGLDGCDNSVSHLVSDEQEMGAVLAEEVERGKEQEDGDDEFQLEGEDSEMEFEKEEEEENNDNDFQEEEEHSELELEEGEEEVNDDDDYQKDGKDSELYPEQYVQHLNPYFVARIRGQRKNELYVSLDVIRDFGLTLEDKKDITFLNPCKRKSIGKVVKWKDGRICIRGWRSFCNQNRVDHQRDTCICEFLLEKEQEDEIGQKNKIIQVHIVRSRKRTKSQKPSMKQNQKKT